MKKIFITIAVISCMCISACASSEYTTPKDSKHIDENPHAYATEILNRDFDVIKRVLQILEKVSNCLDNSEPISRETFGEIIEIINEFSERRHQEKEAIALFPLLKAECGGEKKDFLGRLLMEHVSARDQMRDFADAINNIYQGKKAKKQITKIAYGYIKWMKKHMQTEEKILFPWVNKILTEDKQGILIEKFEAMEKEDIDNGRYEKYMTMIERLENQLGLCSE
ncbi:MAG: hemerythrin domain-containing protein [Planctomycetota bacterium]|nr:hemerythrin domain-containing protein [Planctomycetota bacterium]MDE2217655.1 hemerythrin domain-containing protein [Planctomycetota bacterium]